MALQPVNRRSVPEDVFEQIIAEVLSGEMQPGEALPSERRLAEVLGVPGPRSARRSSDSRPPAWSRCVRATPPPSATSAATPGSTCSPACSSAPASSTSAVVRSILETRLHNGPKVAELAARRRRPELAGLLDDTLQKLAGGTTRSSNSASR